jgi:hypothetical protein
LLKVKIKKHKRKGEKTLGKRHNDKTMTTEEQLKEIVERTQIADLLIRYFAAVDDKSIDIRIVKATFTPDAKIIRPDGSEMAGQENILGGHIKSFSRFKATHHVITNFIVAINNNIATVRSNMIANHVWADNEDNPSLNNKYFLADGVLSAKAIKVDNDWRISELKNNVVWRTGDGMKEMLDFFKHSKK